MKSNIPNEANGKPDHSGRLNEPQTSYGIERKKKLRIFKSFEEAAEAEAVADASQTPIERIRETVELILRVYGLTREDLKARNKKLHINIIKGQ